MGRFTTRVANRTCALSQVDTYDKLLTERFWAFYFLMSIAVGTRLVSIGDVTCAELSATWAPNQPALYFSIV
jgi:hypothetical protein